ncbi:MAG: hypothetical protein WCO49_19330, partial [Nostocales cyanobacterium ELA608]
QHSQSQPSMVRRLRCLITVRRLDLQQKRVLLVNSPIQRAAWQLEITALQHRQLILQETRVQCRA